jgi:hypothetical protein
MEIIPVTSEQVLAFVAVTLVPAIVDILRVGIFQISANIGWDWLTKLAASSKFGIGMTMTISLLAGVILAVWLGGIEPTINSIVNNSLVILGWATAVYKGGYEKSNIRKAIVTVVDKIGIKSENIDKDVDLPDQTESPIDKESVG